MSVSARIRNSNGCEGGSGVAGTFQIMSFLHLFNVQFHPFSSLVSLAMLLEMCRRNGEPLLRISRHECDVICKLQIDMLLLRCYCYCFVSECTYAAYRSRAHTHTISIRQINIYRRTTSSAYCHRIFDIVDCLVELLSLFVCVCDANVSIITF